MKFRYSGSTIISKIVNSLLLPIAALGYYKYFFAPNKALDIYDYSIGIILFLILTFAVANLKFLDEKWEQVILYIKHKNLIYGYIKMEIEYLDNEGKRVALRRKDYVSSVSINAKSQLEPIPLDVTGSISRSETTAVNAEFSLNDTDTVLYFFSSKEDRINNGVAFYSTVMIDTFTEKTEFMNFDVKNFCKFYRLEVIIPSNRKIVSYRLLKKQNLDNQNTDKFWTDVTKKRVLKSHSFEKTSIIAYIENLNPHEDYKLEWTID